jgi:putative membrane protein
VKSFAAKLEKDHTQANDELKEVASKKSITLPAAPSKNHQALHDKLAKLSGAEFDKATSRRCSRITRRTCASSRGCRPPDG